ncbi:MAG: hypothetical protein J4G05_01990 [Chlorobi bacterium]|nr:hypothetical protein [Chlorobiota bacterium]
MNTADLITSFFNNEMSPDQERQFLLSVASSDSLRLGLKSHVMLDKILNEQADKTRVSSGVRTSVMKEAALVTAAVGSVTAAEAAVAQKEAPLETEVVLHHGTSNNILRHIPRWVSGPLVLLLAVGSFFVGYYAGDGSNEEGVQNLMPATSIPVEQQPSSTGDLSIQTVPVEENVLDGQEAKSEESLSRVGTSVAGSMQSRQNNSRDPAVVSEFLVDNPDIMEDGLTTTAADANTFEGSGPPRVTPVLGRRSTQNTNTTNIDQE